MDAGYTLIVKFGERGLARKCAGKCTRGELVEHICTKWEGITSAEIFMSYDLLGMGELDLADDEDMATLFRLMDEMQTHMVRIVIRRVGALEGNVSESSKVNAGRELLLFDDGRCEDGAGSDAVGVGFSAQRLRSVEWKQNYGVDISYCVAWKSMDRGRSIIFGDHSASFASLPMYLDELVKTNPDSHVHLDVNDGNKFRRYFFAFGACLMGFKQCRPLVMVDGTFLKGLHRGALLSAVAKDGDEGIELMDVCFLQLL